MTSFAPVASATSATSADSPRRLPALGRLLARLRLRRSLGVLAEATALAVGIGVLAGGIAVGLCRVENGPALAVAAAIPAILTLAFWLVRARPRIAPLTVLAQAEQTLRLQELWTTAWTLAPLAAQPSVPAASAVAQELTQQIQSRAEAAALQASAADLLPPRLPAYGGLALLLAGIGLGVGLRPQADSAEWTDTAPTNLAVDAPDAAGGGAPGGRNPTDPPKPAADPTARVVLHKLTPEEAAQHRADLDKALHQIDTPEKLRAAQAQFAALQKEQPLPAEQLKAFDDMIHAAEKRLADAASAHGSGTRPGDTDPAATGHDPATDPDFSPVSLLTKDHTMNPAVLREAEKSYPEYSGALTRYVEWLAKQTPQTP